MVLQKLPLNLDSAFVVVYLFLGGDMYFGLRIFY